jgi:hypothetical protein
MAMSCNRRIKIFSGLSTLRDITSFMSFIQAALGLTLRVLHPQEWMIWDQGNRDVKRSPKMVGSKSFRKIVGVML